MWSAVTPPHPNQTQRPASSSQAGTVPLFFCCAAAFSTQPSPQKGFVQVCAHAFTPLKSFIKFDLNLFQMDGVCVIIQITRVCMRPSLSVSAVTGLNCTVYNFQTGMSLSVVPLSLHRQSVPPVAFGVSKLRVYKKADKKLEVFPSATRHSPTFTSLDSP